MYSISILYFDIGKGMIIFTMVKTRLRSTHRRSFARDREGAGCFGSALAIGDIPLYFLIRVNEFDQVATTPLEEWLDYLKNDYIRPDTKTPGLKEARKSWFTIIWMKQNEPHDRHVDAIMIQNDVLGTAKLEGLVEVE